MENDLNEIYTSSSEEDALEDEFIFDNIDIILQSARTPHTLMYYDVDKYSDEQFKTSFRVSKRTANYFIEEYEKSSFYKSKGSVGNKENSAQKQMLSFLSFAAHDLTYREIANLYNYSISRMHRQLHTIIEFFFDRSKKVIKFPSTDEEKLETAGKFAKISRLENVLGCIDGCYIYIRNPAKKIGSANTNRQDVLEITLQCISNADMKFTDVFVGAPSKIYDTRLYEMFLSEKLSSVCGQQYHILGDTEYPLREYLLTPYNDFRHLTRKQILYNREHWRVRVEVENVLELLKQRFRQLQRLDFLELELETMSKFVVACCVLHNSCIDLDDHFVEYPDELQRYEGMDSNENNPQAIINQDRDDALRRLGELKRNSVAEKLS